LVHTNASTERGEGVWKEGRGERDGRGIDRERQREVYYYHSI
jgi:hypothetical protein